MRLQAQVNDQGMLIIQMPQSFWGKEDREWNRRVEFIRTD